MLDKSEMCYKYIDEPSHWRLRNAKQQNNTVFAVWIIAITCTCLTLFGSTLILIQRTLENYNDVSDAVKKAHYRANIYSMLEEQDVDTSEQQRTPQPSHEESEPKIISCYYDTPSPHAPGQLLPDQIHPHLCTHINIAFARVVDKQIYLEDIQYKAMRDIVKLKKVNPHLKVLLSIGGAGNDNGFPEMVENHASRKLFIKSIKYILRNYSLDGIDLDWEFPGFNSVTKSFNGKRERQHFSQLLREIRTEYIREKRNYLLTLAVAAPETVVNIAYDVDQINLYADYVNIMTYDYHSYTKYTPFTGLNSPLYARSDESLYMATLNMNYTVHMYLNKGLDRSKIVVGIPAYGHTFTLVNPGNTRVGSPASGFGKLGSMGFVNYPDVCEFLRSHGDAVVVEDEEARVPYTYRGREWASFESERSAAAKAGLARALRLAGAMVYSLNADDFAGACAPRGTNYTFPLLCSIHDSLFGNTTSPDRRRSHAAPE